MKYNSDESSVPCNVSRRAALRVLGMGVVASVATAACRPDQKKPAPSKAKPSPKEAPAKEVASAPAEATAKAESAAEAKAPPEPVAKAEPAPKPEAAPEPVAKVEAKPEAKPAEVAKAEPAAEAAKPAPKAAPTAGASDCTDGADLDAASKNMRKALQYVSKSKKANQVCSGCLQYLPPSDGGNCGGCKLFSGPVNASGYCLSYAPKKA